MISYNVENVKLPKIEKRKYNAWISVVANKYNKSVGDVAYIFCDDAKILEVNKQYLQHNYFTDIITFDYCEGKKLNGDIFISLDTVKNNAEEFNTTFDDELRRVMIHGILHLTGQADKTDKDAAEMHRKEDEALKLFATLNQ